MKTIFLKFSCLLTLIFFSCQNAENSKNSIKQLPNTPETVARQWQKYIDKNEFAAAKKLSTQNGVKWIEEMELLFSEIDIESVLDETNFLKMNCQEKNEKAFCVYKIQEEEFEIVDTFFLEKMEGQWVVDIPEI